MASPWCRLWADMPNDPKWRTIARASKQSIGNVVAVYIHLMTCASTQPNANERGQTHGWRDEDVANALDIEIEQVTQIMTAMEGRVIKDGYLTGWERRQSIREDEGAAERAKAFREREKAKKEAAELASRTLANASERNRTTEVDVEVDVEKKELSKPKKNSGTRLSSDWKPTEEHLTFCKTERPDLLPHDVANRFVDYWVAQPGSKGTKADWMATWRNWVRNERKGPVAIAQPKVKDWE